MKNVNSFVLLFIFSFVFQLEVLASKPLVQWAGAAGGANGDESVYVTTVDNKGCFLVAGTSKSSSFSFNNTALSNSNPSYPTSFVAKYDTEGKLLWARGGGAGNSYSIVAMETDIDGNIYVSGSFNSSKLKIGNFTLTNDAEYTYGKVFIIKYSPNGDVVWAIAPDIYLSSGTGSLCVGSSGNFYITGHFQDVNMTFGSVKLKNKMSPQQDVFLIKFDSTGKALWGKSFGGTWHDVGRGVAVANDGNILLSGVYKSTVFDIGNISLSNGDTNFNNVFLAKLTPTGDVLWAKSVGNEGEEFCKSVSVDKYGNSFICGSFRSRSISFGSVQLQNTTSSTKSFLAKFDSQGNALWAKTSQQNGIDDFSSVVADDEGNSYVCGNFDKSEIIYDSKTLNNKKGVGKDMVIAKYNQAGDIEWIENFGDVEDVVANSCSLGSDGDVFIGGDFRSKTCSISDYNLNNVSQNRSSDILFFKIKQVPDTILAKYCTANNAVTLSVDSVESASYVWQDSTGDTISVKSYVLVNNPKEGDVYTCQISFPGSASMLLKKIIGSYSIKADFNYKITECASNQVQFTDKSITSHSPLTYKWDFGDGYFSNEQNPIHKYMNPGIKRVVLEVLSAVSECPDTIVKEIEVFSPMKVSILGDSLCCEGSTLVLKAVGADSYLWSDGSTTDSLIVDVNSGTVWVVGIYGENICQSDTVYKTIVNGAPLLHLSGYLTYCPDSVTNLTVSGAKKYFWSTGELSNSVEIRAPGGNYWVWGLSEGGCYSDTLFFSVNEESDWDFSISGQMRFCHNDSTLISVHGSVTNKWFDNSTQESLFITKSGDYSVRGYNGRGCEKQLKFSVSESELPNSEFVKSIDVVDTKNNSLTVSVINPEAETDYSWEMGDGSIFSGLNHTHIYNVRNNQIEYIVRLIAINKYGCVNYSEQSVDVIPFIPNVFTPNNDGVNDIFVPDIDVLIVDRYGKTLYRGKEGWNGTFNGREVPQDTYFYFVYYTDKYGTIQTRKGSVALIR